MERAAFEAVFENDYVLVQADHHERLVLVDRKPQPFQALQDFVATVDDILAAVTRANALDYGLLYDTRQGPPPGGKTYMKAFTRMAEELSSRFRRVAAVVADADTLEAVRVYAPSRVQFFVNPTAARTALHHMARE